jgi:CBS domain-containing protein
MPDMLKPFLNVTAADLMSPTVTLIPREMSLRGAARILSRAQISGAPVIDHNGRCVGVLSVTDFMHFVENGEEPDTERIAHKANIYSASQLIDPEELPADQVSAFMTLDPVTARPAARITELAGKMVDAHIHRIVVVDDENRPIGIVSSTDILAAVARHRTGGKPSIRSDPLSQNEEVASCTQTLR